MHHEPKSAEQEPKPARKSTKEYAAAREERANVCSLRLRCQRSFRLSAPFVALIMEWGNEESLKLIEIYKQFPVLWNYKHDFYHNKVHKQQAWSDIAEAAGNTVMEVKRKMESLLSSFRRERAKGKIIVGTGEDAREVYRSKWFAFKSLSFIIDRDELRKQPNHVENSDGSTYDASELTVYDNTQEAEDAVLFAVEAIYQGDAIPGSSTETKIAIQDQSKDPNGDKGDMFQRDPSQKSPDELNSTRRISRRKAPKRPASDCDDDPRIDEALDILKTAVANKVRAAKKDDCSIYGEHVANKLREYSKRTKAIVQHHISNILFQADMGNFDEASYTANLISNSTNLSSLLTAASGNNTSDISASSPSVT